MENNLFQNLNFLPFLQNGTNGQQNSNPALLQGGVQKEFKPLGNFAEGFQENYTTPLRAENLKFDTQKPFSKRLGESFGTGMRAFDSPLGRGLLSAGLSAALGGNANTVAREGLKGFVGRQNAYSADKLYRKKLGEMGIDTSNVFGNVDKDIYDNLSTSYLKQQQMKIRQAIANAKDNTQRLKIIMNCFTGGSISGEQAKSYMNLYGIGFDSLSPSNQTRNTDSMIRYRNAQLGQKNRALDQREQVLRRDGYYEE